MAVPTQPGSKNFDPVPSLDEDEGTEKRQEGLAALKLIVLVMGPGQKILTRVGSTFCGSGRVRSGQPFMVWVRIWKISPKNVKFFNFFPFGSKKIASGRVGKYQGQSRVGLLFTVGQK